MTTREQNMLFIRDMYPPRSLSDFIIWLQKNVNPEDVFTQKQLEYWAEMDKLGKELLEGD